MKKAEWRFQFYKNYKFRFLPYFHKRKLMWKDKFETPRLEYEPQFRIEWLMWGFEGTQGDDQYWEQWLWIHKYHDGDINKAEETWPWTSMDTKKSSWKNYQHLNSLKNIS